MPNPIIWTKLGSTSEIDSPEAGSLITRSGFADFRACKFGNGASGTASGNYVKYSTAGMDATKGCMECWIKFNTQDVTNGIYSPSCPPTARSAFGIGGGSSGNSLQFNIYTTGYESYGHAVYVDGSFRIQATNVNKTKDNAYHVAVVWDNNGIGGSGDKLRLYVDGIQKAASATKGGPSSISSCVMVGNLIWSQIYSFYSPSGYECALDNFKAWDYAKTDFSDRFAEGGGGASVKLLYSNKYNPGGR